ncbi:hypothetical protein LSH36_128g01022 [Paralvinella palmiformis]|uniref:C-type lectin domain-containing protein n=1 Tax=Paralvinella palmiformis TaxID=53620 RepID=A0AAD9JXS5_9ANNE|nr:hypothetical protein LSH36_128g01022 [Paralvinella palmiformis]
MVLMVYCLAFGLFALRVNSCKVDKYCHGKTFYEFENKSYPGDVLVQEGPWPLHECRRLCRLYLECWYFSIEWYGDRFGMCTIFRGAWKSSGIVQANGVTLYLSCPDGFQWDVDARKCYSSEIYGPVKGGDTIGRCQSILPEAQPFEPKDDSQMAYVRRAAGVYYIWMGMRRPENSTDVHDFRYYSNGKPIEYEYWDSGNPDDTDHDCVLSVSFHDYRWIDTGCEFNKYVICEL